jgi:RPA family protein
MAIKVEFDGWVNEVKVFDWGTVLKVSHDQRSKNAQTGEWETTGKDYFDITVTPEQASAVSAAKVIHVVGNIRKIETFEKRDGSVGVSVKVRAVEVSPVERGFKGDPVATVTNILAPVASDDLPF